MASKGGSSLCNVSAGIQQYPTATSSGEESNTSFYSKYRHFRFFKRKGAVLVLLWSFCSLFAFNFVAKENNRDQHFLSLRISPLTVFVMCALFYPILGWMADARYGRYKMIKWSLLLMWVSFILYCLALVVLKSIHLAKDKFNLARSVLGLVTYAVISLGLGGFQANIVQFGVDQLVDATSCEITSFLRWYLWIWFLSGVVQAVSQSCLCPDYEPLGSLLLPTLMTFAVVLDLFFNHWLVKEPSSSNPFHLIYKVLHYAAKNKYPRLRSAFTYWEDKPYSRIDLAKDKYGGPFTTEQVEDVKTFFRIVSIVAAGGLFVGIYMCIYPTYDKVWSQLYDKSFVDFSETDCGSPFVRSCLLRISFHYIGHYTMVIALPFFEFILYPLFKRYFKTYILRRAGYGLTVIAVGLVACTTIEFVANHQNPSTNTTACLLDTQFLQHNDLPLDYRWMSLPFFMNSIGQYLVFTSAAEFLCAQSPYSLKGFLFGLVYGCAGFFAILGYGIMWPVGKVSKQRLSGGYGCMSWYLLISSVFLLGILLMIYIALKCYKKRMRNDSEHNEQIFAVNYYSQCHDSTE